MYRIDGGLEEMGWVENLQSHNKGGFGKEEVDWKFLFITPNFAPFKGFNVVWEDNV